jgi:hypothetical protein
MITSLNREIEVRKSVEELNPEVSCTFADWQAQVATRSAEPEQTQREAERDLAADFAECAKGALEPANPPPANLGIQRIGTANYPQSRRLLGKN